ncbi:hypothetical protein DFJ74DRAFT_751054 [Hyaloraphidium curvatum]|nr:hypothetical protein DFJ74DRAFT_751054 [Hyaloraphidium curvatum]
MAPGVGESGRPAVRYLPVFGFLAAPLAAIFALFGLISKSFEQPDDPAKPAPTKGPAVWAASALTTLLGAAACVALGQRARLAPFRPAATVRSSAAALGLLCALAVTALALCLWYYLATRPLPDNWEYSEGYYNTLSSGLLAAAGAALLALDWLWTEGFADAGPGLTHVQARLVFWVGAALLYASLLSLLFAMIERWSYRDASFFVLATLTTIGFGSPKTPREPLGRALVILGAAFGIGLFAATIKSVADALDESLREGVMLRWRKLRRRRGGEREDVGYQELSALDPDEWEGGGRSFGGRIMDGLEAGWDGVARLLRLKGGAAVEVDVAAEPDAAPGKGDLEMADTHPANGTAPSDGGQPAGDEPPALTAQSIADLIPNFRRRFVGSLLALLVFWLLSSAIFFWTESDQKWTFFDAFYFSFIRWVARAVAPGCQGRLTLPPPLPSFSTIGYGDLYPSSSGGLAYFNVFVFLGIGTLTYFASTAALWARQAHDREGFMREVVRMQEEEEARSKKGAGAHDELEGGSDDDGEDGGEGEEEAFARRGAGRRKSTADAVERLLEALGRVEAPKGSELDRAREAAAAALAAFAVAANSTPHASPRSPRSPVAAMSLAKRMARAPLSPTEVPPLLPPSPAAPAVARLPSSATRTGIREPPPPGTPREGWAGFGGADGEGGETAVDPFAAGEDEALRKPEGWNPAEEGGEEGGLLREE